MSDSPYLKELSQQTKYLLETHKKLFNSKPSKKQLMKHIQDLQDEVEILNKELERYTPTHDW